MGDITDDEKIRISQQFLLNSPPGEFNEVITDVRGLLGNDELLNKTALSAFKAHNLAQALPVELPGLEYKGIVCEKGEVDPTHYRDPRGKQVFEFDQVKQEATGLSPDDLGIDEELEGLRASVDESLGLYCFDHYLEGASAVYPERNEAGAAELTAVISSHKYSPKNYWNGRWKSLWRITIDGASAKLEGKITIDVHYYEDGNVQLNCDYDKADDFALDDPTNPGAAIANRIKAIELAYQESMNEVYVTMSQQALKVLRRDLPITKSKLDFHKIASHKVAGELASKATS